MTEQTERIQHMIEALREAGHRITPQRTAVAEVLVRSVTHPSVESIYEELQPRFPSMSLATVYKTVALFVELGLVLDLGTHNDERRYDGRCTRPHLHLLCERCGAVYDCEDAEIPAHMLRRAAKDSGFEVRAVRCEVIGICAKCREEMAHELATVNVAAI
jgi:Fur family transcriptional regulator, peroxide stress response regulator